MTNGGLYEFSCQKWMDGTYLWKLRRDNARNSFFNVPVFYRTFLALALASCGAFFLVHCTGGNFRNCWIWKQIGSHGNYKDVDCEVFDTFRVNWLFFRLWYKSTWKKSFRLLNILCKWGYRLYLCCTPDHQTSSWYKVTFSSQWIKLFIYQ